MSYKFLTQISNLFGLCFNLVALPPLNLGKCRLHRPFDDFHGWCILVFIIGAYGGSRRHDIPFPESAAVIIGNPWSANLVEGINLAATTKNTITKGKTSTPFFQTMMVTFFEIPETFSHNVD